jgi:hypothetical protein
MVGITPFAVRGLWLVCVGDLRVGELRVGGLDTRGEEKRWEGVCEWPAVFPIKMNISVENYETQHQQKRQCRPDKIQTKTWINLQEEIKKKVKEMNTNLEREYFASHLSPQYDSGTQWKKWG